MVKKTSRRSKKPVKREPAPPLRTTFLELFIRFWVTLGLVALILYAGLLLMSRTDGFRHLLAEHLESRLGLPVRIQNSQFDWDLNLRLMNLEGSEDLGMEAKKRKPDPVGRVTAKLIYIKWALRREGYRPVPEIHYLVAEGVQVDLVEKMSGEWQPMFFNVIATLPDAIDVQHFQDSLGKYLDRLAFSGSGEAGAVVRPAVPFAIRDAEFRWIRRNGRYWAGGQKVSLKVAPLEVTGRNMTHYKFSSGAVLLPGDVQLTDLSFEVMHSRDGLLVLEEGLASLEKSWFKRIIDGRSIGAPGKRDSISAPLSSVSGEVRTVSPLPAPAAVPSSDPLQASIRRALEEAVVDAPAR